MPVLRGVLILTKISFDQMNFRLKIGGYSWWINYFAALSVFQRTRNGDKVEHDDVGDHLTEPDAARMRTHLNNCNKL